MIIIIIASTGMDFPDLLSQFNYQKHFYFKLFG